MPKKIDPFRFESGGMAARREQRERMNRFSWSRNLEKARAVKAALRKEAEDKIKRHKAYMQEQCRSFLKYLYQEKEMILTATHKDMKHARNLEAQGLVTIEEQGVLTLGETTYRVTIAGTNVHNSTNSSPVSDRKVEI